jgi:hypothetical protein
MLWRLAASHRTLTVAPTLGVTTRTASGTREHEAPLARPPRTGCPRLITQRSQVQILPRYLCDVSGHRVLAVVIFGAFGWVLRGLVVDVWVEDEFAYQFAWVSGSRDSPGRALGSVSCRAAGVARWVASGLAAGVCSARRSDR